MEFNAGKSPSIKASKVYPFSSARQALHNQRRAQGGPGITEGKNPQPRRNTYHIDVGNLPPAEAKEAVERVVAEITGA